MAKHLRCNAVEELAWQPAPNRLTKPTREGVTHGCSSVYPYAPGGPLMPWVRYDDRFTKHPKVRKAAKLLGGKFGLGRVVALHHEATEYCNVHLTDGFLSRENAVELDCDPDPIEVMNVLALKSVRLAERVRGGWKLHDYHDYQPSKESVLEDRRKEAERKRRVRAGQKADAPSVREMSHPDSGVESGGPSRPVPSLPDTAPLQDQDHRADARAELAESERVLIRLAHDALSQNPDDATEILKDLAAKAHIPYDGIVIQSALSQAEAQRSRRSYLRAVES